MKYRSCAWIESHVVLDMKELKFCCVPHSKNKGFVKICDYEGGPLPVEGIREARRRLIEENNTEGVETGCTGCHFLEEKDWDAERGSEALFDSVHVSNYSICNLRCRYCFVYLYEGADRPDVGYDLLPVFRELVEDGHLAEGSYVEWGGGEPTILPGFPEIERMLLDRGCRQQVSTSGVRHSPEIEEGLAAGKISAVTSVDSGTPETYLEVKGRDHHTKVWENIRKYAATGGDMTVKYILRRNNSDGTNIRRFLDDCARCGVRKVVVTPDMWEVAQDTVTEETLFAFARMKFGAKRRGIPILIRPEYLNPEDMRRARKYIPLELNAWRYGLHRLRRAAGSLVQALRRRLEGLRFRSRTREALQKADELLARKAEVEGTRERIVDLLDYQTRHPDPELGDRVTRLVRDNGIATRRIAKSIPVVGTSGDGWTTDAKPAYLLVEPPSEDPCVPEVYLACYAPEDAYPVKVTVSDGIHDDIEYKFLEPERRRFELRPLAPGQKHIYRVETDKSWTSAEDANGRALGVHISDMSGA